MHHRRESTFYEDGLGAPAIMTLTNLPDDVLPLLQMESLATFGAMEHLSCTTLVELGCYDGRGLEIARALDARYVGVDLDKNAIATLKLRIQRESLSEVAKTILQDLVRFVEEDKSVADERALYLLPFNLLSNFRKPDRLLRALSKRKVGAVITVFRDTTIASRVRRTYYQRCGIRGLSVSSTAEGIVFTGANNFYSRSFSDEDLLQLLSSYGLQVVHSRKNAVAHCVTVLLD
ncbi:MAG: class I SAM-dependent methyltransferase [Myxococcota bacterium]